MGLDAAIPNPEDFPSMLDEATIRGRVKELGEEIGRDYRDKGPIVAVCILKGCIVFFSDLIRSIEAPLQTEFMGISSYGDSTKSSGVVQITTDLTSSIVGKHVLIVEDIVDTGLTMRYLVDNFKTREPASVSICTLLHKAENDQSGLNLDYVGFSIPNEFVVGYGLDYKGYLRNLPYIGSFKGET